MGTQTRRDQSTSGTLPFPSKLDTEAQAGLPLSGYPVIVVAVECFQPDIEDLQGDLGTKPCINRGLCQSFRFVPDIVDGGKTGLNHVDHTQPGKIVPVLY